MVRGTRLVAELPASLFGDKPLEKVGVAAAVSGTVYNTTFRTEVEAQVRTWFVREVTQKPGRCGRWEEAIDGAPCTFGGCQTCTNHPRLIDVLHPKKGLQEKGLSKYLKGLAGEVPLVYRGQEAPKVPELPVATVAERKGSILTLTLPDNLALQKLTPGKLLDGLDDKGRVKATVVVVSVVDKTLVVRVVDGKPETVASVRFTADMRL